MTSNAVQPFNFQGQQVHASLDEHGAPWFFAADVCQILGLTNRSQALARLEPQEKGVTTRDTPGGRQQVNTVNESGLYGLIFTSRRAEAVAFRLWVTGEVLPAIRRTGTYSVEPVPLAIPQTFAEALRLAADNLDRAEAAEARAGALQETADVHQALTDARGAMLVREAAPIVGMSEGHLRRWLIEQGMVYTRSAPVCGARMYDRYAKHADHFTATAHTVRHFKGTCTHHTLHLTPRGLDLVVRRLRVQDGAL